MYDFLKSIEDMLTTVFIVSAVNINEGKGGDMQGETGIGVAVKHAEGEKCERCWGFSKSVGECSEHPTLCARCAAIINK